MMLSIFSCPFFATSSDKNCMYGCLCMSELTKLCFILVKCLFRSFDPFGWGLFADYTVVRVLYIFCMKVLYQVYTLQVFSPSLVLVFSSSQLYLGRTILNFHLAQFIHVFFMNHGISKKPLFKLRSQKFSHMFSCTSFVV